MESNNGARRSEDIALDLLKFLAATTNVAKTGAGSTTGFAAPAATKPEDHVTQLLDLYARCRIAVESTPVAK